MIVIPLCEPLMAPKVIKFYFTSRRSLINVVVLFKTFQQHIQIYGSLFEADALVEMF